MLEDLKRVTRNPGELTEPPAPHRYAQSWEPCSVVLCSVFGHSYSYQIVTNLALPVPWRRFISLVVCKIVQVNEEYSEKSSQNCNKMIRT